jgi:16S rRNA (cytosine967-C5)-methyltransferase
MQYLTKEYADKVVARALKKTSVGEVLTESLAETIYEIVRWKRLYAEIASKGTFDRDNLWRMFSVWAVLRGINSDWRQLEGT